MGGDPVFFIKEFPYFLNVVNPILMNLKIFKYQISMSHTDAQYNFEEIAPQRWLKKYFKTSNLNFGAIQPIQLLPTGQY